VPEAGLVLLANEGCLERCPFRPAHESHIGLGRMEAGDEASGAEGFRLARELGCGRRFHDHPEELLKSPFIRPEDAGLYEEHVDGLKLCGRTRGPQALRDIVAAYLRGRWEGNLLELCDSMEGLAQRLDLPNEGLPEDFGQTVTGCHSDCAACGYCAELAWRLVQRRRPSLRRLG
jgi:collagenase-like PrtC family protease